jgi:glycosyltransferase involved in cell wall biosynthesis
MEGGSKRKTILFVGMVNSPHVARWIDLIADAGWDLHFFPVQYVAPHSLLRSISIYKPYGIRLLILLRQILRLFYRFSMYLMSRFGFVNTKYTINSISKRDPSPQVTSVKNNKRSLFRRDISYFIRSRSDLLIQNYAKHINQVNSLKRFIIKTQPDLIHSMEFQHAGYLVLSVFKQLDRCFHPKWLASNWGSDIFYYQSFQDHKVKIKQLLQLIDYYSAECHRDVDLAVNLGFNGKTMPVFPHTGGFDLEKTKKSRDKIPPSKRNIIMVKGYQSFSGRALIALSALEACQDDLKTYRIIVYSAAPSVVACVNRMVKKQRINIEVLPKVTHEEMLAIHAQSRIHLGVSVSDGISTALLEAMAMGSFPIQTNTSCCYEWIKNGETGFSVDLDDRDDMAKCIQKALKDDALVDSAAAKNWQVVCDRLDKNILKEKEMSVYESIFMSNVDLSVEEIA